VKTLDIGDWRIAHDVSEWIEVGAVVIIAGTVVIACSLAIAEVVTGRAAVAVGRFKDRMAHGLLIGLDLLIAADVIRTVTLEPTLENVAALGLLVVVRTFLAWSLVVETEHRWPWQTSGGQPPGT
jgi:uncharacterized membrane protein